jgi:hypothetical protein
MAVNRTDVQVRKNQSSLLQCFWPKKDLCTCITSDPTPIGWLASHLSPALHGYAGKLNKANAGEAKGGDKASFMIKHSTQAFLMMNLHNS